MEKAAKELYKSLMLSYPSRSYVIVCGPGNNGGDGLVLARFLVRDQIKVKVFIPRAKAYSKEFEINLQRLKDLDHEPKYFDQGFKADPSDVIIDAMFGTGLSRPLEGQFGLAVQWMNSVSLKKISIDMPSGMPDTPIFDLTLDNCVAADHVLCLEYPKLSMLLPYSNGFINSFELVHFGIVPFQGESKLHYVSEYDVVQLYDPPKKFYHKYSKGHAMVIGGSSGMSGAILLSTEAAFRCGCGLVTAGVPESVLPSLQCRLPEALTVELGKAEVNQVDIPSSKIKALGCGPGMRISDLDTQREVIVDVLNAGIPTVLDAEALHFIARHNLFEMLPHGTILTPHEGEFKTLVGEWESDIQKLDLLREFSNKYEVIVVLKGAHTIVCDGEDLYFNSIGHPAMGTAGSGDVLLGILTSLLAQGYNPKTAAIIGVFVHAKASLEFLDQSQGITMMASDITRHLGKILLDLTRK